VGQVCGFSLHAGVAAKAYRRQKPTPEAGTAVPHHLTPCGVGEAPVAHRERQHPLPAQDAVPRWHHHVIFEPLDFIARLAALVPKPRVNLPAFMAYLPPTVETAPR
jgi:hypothetical protein